ncbi:hypothetical protein [Wolbachia endosymbiont (group E) of Neria commutata]|uniref:hypothetical protein n=1 Tax=Wolbachia endosymbiont (group E) of Neria commutata TaxID=3066149 RepID=UPI0031329AE5
MFIPNNDIKIVCKLEKDDGNTVKINPSSQGTEEDHAKVKVTTPASNISISDIFNFSPGYFDVDQQWQKFQFHANHSSIHNTRLVESYQFSKIQDYLYAKKMIKGY